jgi:hypothetical protein
LRWAELVGLGTEGFQVREEHWVIADLIGKGKHIRTVPVPVWAKRAVDEWIAAAGINGGAIFRRVSRLGKIWGDSITPRKNALLKEGDKSDKMDARKLADLLRGGYLRSLYHGENGLRTLKELARSYLTIGKDLTRVMNRVKALYRSWGILCEGQQVYAPRHRAEWLKKIGEAGVRRRAEFFYQQLDALQGLRQAVRKDLLAESRKQSATKLLRQVPSIGPIRAALLIALIQTPHRFRTKRQLWTYSGLAIETRDSAQYHYVGEELQRSKKPQQLRGLNQNLIMI